MNIHTVRVAPLALALGLISGAAQAELQGRDLNGSLSTSEAWYDTDLNITWLANAKASGPMTWSQATTWVSDLSFFDALNNITYDNWRLPNVNPVNGSSYNYTHSYDGSTDLGYNISEQGTAYAGSTGSELAHLFYNTLNNKGYCPVSTNCSPAPQAGWGLTNIGPFSGLVANGLQPYGFWSGSGYASDTGYAWIFYFDHGSQVAEFKGLIDYAWAVSPGDVGAIPEADTWAMLLAGLGLVGAAVRRRR